MPTSAPFRLNKSGMLLALISAAFAGQAAATAGRVDFAAGGVTVAGRDGQQRPLARGTELDSGDTIRTSADGRAQIRFTDGSYVSLQPNTDFAISDYRYDGRADGSERGFYGLVRGAMRTVTGAIGRVNRSAYRVTTPTATVGIRGTGGVIQVLNDGSTLVIGTSGIWSLTNPAGSIDVPAGVSGLAPSEPNTPPRESNTQPQTSTAPVQPVDQPYQEGNNVNPDGTAVITEPIKPLVTGAGYAPAVAFTTFGLLLGGDGGEGDGSTIGSAVFNETGQLTELMLGNDHFQLGTGRHAEFGTDGILAWGRWVGTIITHPTACEGPCTDTYNDNQGFHYVIGMPTPTMPIGGSFTYSLLGATSPTYVDGRTPPGTFSGGFRADWTPTSYSLNGNFSVSMPGGGGLAARTIDWAASGSGSGATFSMFNTSTSGCATSGCNVRMTGFFSGAGAERAGMSYLINDSLEIIGAAAFKKTP